MENLPCQGCHGLCCGPVPVTAQELRMIRKKVRQMPAKARQELREQRRFPGTCIFFDQEKDKCGIHSARPSICRAFGHFGNLICFRKPEAAKPEHWSAKEAPAGILSVDFTWADFQ
jgi:hypothetical protein